MNRKTRRNIAVVAGLTAVLALSPVAGALTTAHADETASEAVSTQSVEGVDPQSFSAEKWSWWTKEWHLGNWWPWGVWHPEVDFNHNGFCDLCWSWIGDHGCDKPDHGGDTEQETISLSFQALNPVTGEYVFLSTVEQDNSSIRLSEGDVPTPPTYENYEFIGWDYNGTLYQTNNLYGLVGFQDGDVITAKYAPVEPEPVYYTVTFDDMVEDTENQKVTVEEGKSVSDSGAEVSDPTREGYTFEGWYTSTDYTTKFYFSTPINEDMTVYAKWAEDKEPTDPTDPGTDPEEPGTDPDNPGTDEPGTDPENPGTGSGDQGDTTNPDDGSGDQGSDNTDQGDDTTKPAGDATSTDDGSNDDADAADEDAIPNTGDATVAVSGIAALGTAAAGLGVFLRRRS